MEEECEAGEGEERGVLKQAAKNLDSLSWKKRGDEGVTDTDLNPVHFQWVFFSF